jgi:hypothetical protein
MPHDHWLYAAYSQRRHNSAAMRTMLDFLEQSMGPAGEPPVFPPMPPLEPAACTISRATDAVRVATASAKRADRLLPQS